MFYSRVSHAGTGTTAVYSVPFPYINKTYVEVRRAGILLVEGVDYNWPSTTSIALTAGNLGAGVILDIRRNTPKAARLVDFQDASVLTEEHLDLSADQTFHSMQESLDEMESKVSFGADGTVDMQGFRVRNAGAPIAAGDLVTKEFADTVIANASASATAAATSASQAATSAGAAATSASNASASASAASSSATSAGSSATTASNAATTATTQATNASSSATSAAASATSAGTSATNAAASAAAAAASATDAAAAAGYAGLADADAIAAAASAAAAATSASNAATSATAAAGSATSASSSATAASGSATAAASSATSAGTSATTATTKASEAATSASNAATSETNAAASATSASGSASTATTQATNAAASATSASSSASSASTSATNSAASASASATYASNASASASAADASAQAAAASAAQASGGTVKITSADTTAAFLDSKLVVTGSLTKTKLNAGANEQIQLGVSVPVTSVFGRTGAVTLGSSDVTTALGYTPWHSGNDGAGSTLDADTLDGYHASSFALSTGAYVAKDHGHNNIGSLCFAGLYVGASGASTAAGATRAGSSLNAAAVQRVGATGDCSVPLSGSALTGTWRALGYYVIDGENTGATLWQRIS